MGEPERTAERSDLAWQHLGQTPGTPRVRTANVRQCCGEDKQQGGDRGQRRAALLRGRGFRLPWPSVPAFKASATSGRPGRLSAARASPRGAATPPHPQAELCWGRGGQRRSSAGRHRVLPWTSVTGGAPAASIWATRASAAAWPSLSACARARSPASCRAAPGLGAALDAAGGTKRAPPARWPLRAADGGLGGSGP